MRRAVLVPFVLLLALLGACSGGGDPPANTAATTPPATIEATATAAPATATTSTTAVPTAPPTGKPRLGTSAGQPVSQRDPAFTALPGATATFGQLGNAVYRVEMPAKWNGDLVLWAHGFRGFDLEVYVDDPPEALRRAFIDQGYAWAASSYSENGYTPGIGADDSLALKRYFEATFGKPKRTYLTGASMGGNVTVLSMEHFVGEYDGALSLCGAVTGIEQIDYLFSWAMAAEFVSGQALPIGSGQSAMLSAMSKVQAQLKGTDPQPTAKGLMFIDIIRNLTGGPRPFFLEGFKDQYALNFGLLALDPNRSTLVGKAATNAGAVYRVDAALGTTSEAVNAGARRLAADPSARNAEAHPDAVPTTGRLTAPLLTLHGTGDLFVPISLETAYRARVEAAGKGSFLVQRAIRAPGHCNFSAEELRTAWNDLVAWVAGGTKPAGDDLSGDLTDAGRQFTNPLRPGDPGTK
ncbi:MAG: hypothetical protein HY875_08945 [Chloroflexi bacterium]|nr:hypothetical protein [Chloroflexota bacterium]